MQLAYNAMLSKNIHGECIEQSQIVIRKAMNFYMSSVGTIRGMDKSNFLISGTGNLLGVPCFANRKTRLRTDPFAWQTVAECTRCHPQSCETIFTVMLDPSNG